MRKVNKQGVWCAVVVALATWFSFIRCSGQNTPPVKVSLRDIGSPQFPTGFWVSKSDPHFRHHLDNLFWLSSDKVGMSFFEEYCCRTGGKSGVKYVSAVFNTSGNNISKHEWISTPDDPFYVGGAPGFFLAQYRDRVLFFKSDFTLARQISTPKGSHLIWSKRGNSLGVQDGTSLSLYETENLTKAGSIALPPNATAVDVYGDAALVNSSNAKTCYVGILQAAGHLSWTVNNLAEQVPGSCAHGIGLLSADAVLVTQPQRNEVPLGGVSFRLQVVHFDGAVEPITVPGRLLGIADSGRMAFQSFYPSPLAQKLDMDFGSHKEVTVYDPSTKTTVFRTKIGGQAGAALAPDGQHVAVIEGHNLLIYALP